MTDMHPAIAAGVAANEDEARLLEAAAACASFDFSAVTGDLARAIDAFRSGASLLQGRVLGESIVREQMERDREANRTNRKAKRQRGKETRRRRLQAVRRAKLSRWLGSVQESLAGAREAMLAEGWRPCSGCSMLTLQSSCATCVPHGRANRDSERVSGQVGSSAPDVPA